MPDTTTLGSDAAALLALLYEEHRLEAQHRAMARQYRLMDMEWEARSEERNALACRSRRCGALNDYYVGHPEDRPE